MLPRVDSSNTFMKHAPHARQVTWGIINGNRRRKNMDFHGTTTPTSFVCTSFLFLPNFIRISSLDAYSNNKLFWLEMAPLKSASPRATADMLEATGRFSLLCSGAH